MKKLIVIAGAGEYPLAVVTGAKAAGVEQVDVMAVRGATARATCAAADHVHTIGIGEIASGLKWLAAQNYDGCIFAGQINPLALFRSRFDDQTKEWLASLEAKTAHTIYGKLSEEFEKAGVRVLPASCYMDSHLPGEGVLTARSPNEHEARDIAYAATVVEDVGRHDVGQTVLVKDGMVLAVEAFEGTNAAIKRGGKLGGKGAIIFKAARVGHDMRFDIPVVGLTTLKTMRSAGITVLAFQAGRLILLNRAAVIAYANKHGIALIGVKTALPPAPTRPSAADLAPRPRPAPTKRVLLLAGEESGMLYAEQLKKALGNVSIKQYSDFGFKTADLAVMGFWPVVRRLFFFLRVKRTMQRCIRVWQPDAVVGIDYPGLNLKLEEYGRKHGARAIHIVCPQVWAWKQNRIPRIASQLNRLLCFFPFEAALFKPYQSENFSAEFIGHPLVDEFKVLQRQASAERTLALLPGSRIGEIECNLPRMLAALPLLKEKVKVVIPAANKQVHELIDRITGGKVTVTDGGARALLLQADAAAVASGTATLEAALAGVPTVLVYAVAPLLAWFARRVIKGVKHLGLANIIATKAGLEPPMPELLQEEFTAQALAAKLNEYLFEDTQRAAATKALAAATALLAHEGNAIATAANIILKEINQDEKVEC